MALNKSIAETLLDSELKNVLRWEGTIVQICRCWSHKYDSASVHLIIVPCFPKLVATGLNFIDPD